MYPGCLSTLKAVLHDAENPVPIPPTYPNITKDHSTDEAQCDVKDQEGASYKDELDKNKSHFLT